MAAVDYFLKIDGIPGESTDHKHKDEIDVLSFHWGVSRSGTAAFGGGPGAGRVNVQDFKFQMRVNRASPKLMLACATGQHLKFATLVARKVGPEGNPVEYLKAEFFDILVTSYKEETDISDHVMPALATGPEVGPSFTLITPQASALKGADDIPFESVSLNFSKLEVTYIGPDGKPTTGGLDFKKI